MLSIYCRNRTIFTRDVTVLTTPTVAAFNKISSESLTITHVLKYHQLHQVPYFCKHTNFYYELDIRREHTARTDHSLLWVYCGFIACCQRS